MNLSAYQYIVGYGIGQYFEYIKTRIPESFKIDYLCDARWREIGSEYHGIPVISPGELQRLEKAYVIVFSGNARNYQSISGMLDNMKLPYIHADRIFDATYTISGKQLKELGDGVYSDNRGNRIEFCKDIEDAVLITFQGAGNHIKIGKGVSVGGLSISCGNEAVCHIGEGTKIEEAKVYVTNGSIMIGSNCLFSDQVVLRNHDGHHIFDKQTGKRINHSGNMKIGNHVWICHGATLLGSTSIGDNSIVGTMAVTSSAFSKEVIIAGNPARVIRENVCWSKDSTDFYNRECLDDCLAQEARKYWD